MGFVILLISPFILFTSYKEERYPAFFKWSRVWGRLTLTLMGYFTIVKRMGKIDSKQQYVVVANHASELDIMMTLAIVPNCFVFIGKKELAKLPLFGYFYKRTNILVDRKSLKSKKEVMVKAQAKMEEGIGLCIFPEGGIPKKSIKLAPFKMGAFKLAIENQKPILPITFPDNKKHFPDFHEGGYPGRLRATIHEPINTEGLTEEDSAELRDRCYKLIDDELTKFGIV
jgi:1-acyl-sn-glycerol-3-phosphate acyltransferase